MDDTLQNESSVSGGTAAGPAELLRSMSGHRKAAILLLQLDRSASGKVMSQLKDKELSELTTEIARVGEITPEMSAAVMREFGVMISNGSSAHGGADQSRELL